MHYYKQTVSNDSMNNNTKKKKTHEENMNASRKTTVYISMQKRNPSVNLQATNFNLSLCHCTMFFLLHFLLLLSVLFLSSILCFHSGAQLNVYNCHKKNRLYMRNYSHRCRRYNVVSIRMHWLLFVFSPLVYESIELVRHT